jgi:GTP-binding protein
MPKPIVIIIGRQNVGKSTLFNRMTGRRTAIVRDEPGVTRDRIYGEVTWEGKTFSVVDTGGFLSGQGDEILTQVREHALFGMDEADLVIHLLDARQGLLPDDLEIARLIRGLNKQVMWVVNKVDTPSTEPLLADFYELGDDVYPISAEHGLGYDDMMDEAAGRLKPNEEIEADPDAVGMPRVAVVGRPNVGKSTMINALLGKERMIVSPVAGTTRDAVDSVCKYYGREYLLVDTAGIRKKSKVDADVEHYSVLRAIKSIERADIAVLLMDAAAGIIEQDKKIAEIVDKAGKGLIILLNKWDLIEEHEDTYKDFMTAIDHQMHFAAYAHVLTTSGLSRQRITKLFPLIDRTMETRRTRIDTSTLNKLTERINSVLHTYNGRKVKVYYITQVSGEPPQFALFANYPEGIKPAQTRYIERLIREQCAFAGTPIRVYLKKRDSHT